MASGFLLTLLVLGYLVVGAVISAVYTFLASGELHHFIFTIPLAPVAAFLVFVEIPIIEEQMRDRGIKTKRWDRGWWTWVMIIAYLLSPILLNGASILLEAAGFLRVSEACFKIRYLALAVMPAGAIGACLVACGSKALWRRLGGRDRDLLPGSFLAIANIIRVQYLSGALSSVG